MSCNGCPNTVWYDHRAKAWQHGMPQDEETPLCSSPEPYAIKDKNA